MNSVTFFSSFECLHQFYKNDSTLKIQDTFKLYIIFYVYIMPLFREYKRYKYWCNYSHIIMRTEDISDYGCGIKVQGDVARKGGICKMTSIGQRRCKTKQKGQQVQLRKTWFKGTYLQTETCLGQQQDQQISAIPPPLRPAFIPLKPRKILETSPGRLPQRKSLRYVSQLQLHSRSRMSCPQCVLRV